MWFEALDNADAIHSLYDSLPTLKSVWVSKIELQQDGPTVSLHIMIRDLPNHPPKRWSKPYNAVTFKMLLLGANELKIEGWDTANVADVLLQRNETGTIQVSVVGVRLNLSARCVGIRVEEFSPCLTSQQLP